MKKYIRLKDKLRKVVFKSHFYSVLILVVCSTFLTLMVTNFINVPQIRDLVSRNVSYTYRILHEKVVLVQNSLSNNLKGIINEIESSIDESSQKNLDKIFSKYKEKLESIDYVSRADYYLIDEEGKVVLTSYATDLSLNLSKFKNFWKALNENLTANRVLIHPFTAEILTGKSRMYAYKRLRDSKILEIGVEISRIFLEEQFKAITNLKDDRMIDDINIYSSNFKPFGGFFKPLKSSEIKFYTEKLKKSNYYLEGPFRLKKRLIIKINNDIFDNYVERNFIVIDINFFSTYFWNFLSIFLIVIVLFIFSIHNSNKFSKEINEQFESLNNVITSYDPMSFNLEEIYNFKTNIAEFQKIINTFQSMAERISADMQEITAINEELESSYKEIERKSVELECMLLEFSEKLALIAEGHDESMKLHLKRVRRLTKLVVDELELPEKLKSEIYNYSVLHDIGKIFVSKTILDKPGKLSSEEWEQVKKHTIYAKRLLDNPHFKVALNIAMYHHENYDGTGYPQGLKSDEIPIEAQIVKIADVYDALRSERPYKKAFSHEEAMKIIIEGDGRTMPSHFNPKILDIFKSLSDEIKKIYEKDQNKNGNHFET